VKTGNGMRVSGFTFVELAVALAIASVLVLYGVPTMGRAMDNNKVIGAASELSVALALARSTAIGQHHTVVVCPSIDTQRCSDGGSWNRGWIVFDDLNGNDEHEPSEALHSAQNAFGDDGMMVYTTAGRPRVRYQPTGTAGGSNLTFTVCRRNGSDIGRRLIINNVGRVRMEPGLGEGVRCAG
jgi:type IV fimbrial biogenesis protein FimT